MTFEDAYTTYGTPLWHFAYRFLSDPEDARDAVQEAFARAWRRWNAYSGTDRGRIAWLYQIVQNYCIDLLRRRALPAHARYSLDQPVLAAAHGSDRPEERVDLLVDDGPDLCQAAEDAETYTEWRTALAAVRPQYQAALLVVILEERGEDGRRAVLAGMTHSRFKSLLHRARQALRVALVTQAAADDDPIPAFLRRGE